MTFVHATAEKTFFVAFLSIAYVNVAYDVKFFEIQPLNTHHIEYMRLFFWRQSTINHTKRFPIDIKNLVFHEVNFEEKSFFFSKLAVTFQITCHFIRITVANT